MIQNNDLTEVVEIDVTTMTKEGRTKIHEGLKTVFGAKIVASTVTKEAQKFVVVKLFNKKGKFLFIFYFAVFFHVNIENCI